MDDKTENVVFKKHPFITRFVVRFVLCLMASMALVGPLGIILTFSVPHITDVWRMQGWVQASCQIEATNLAKHKDHEESEVFRAEARYRYAYQGRTYQGSRVSSAVGSDNIGPYHERHIAKLQYAMEQNQPVSCLVNPDNPDESVLFAETHWANLTLTNLFAAIFSSVGFLMAAIVFDPARTGRKIAALHRRFPNQPWKWRLEWQADRITPSREYSMVGFSLSCWCLLWVVPPFIGGMIHASMSVLMTVSILLLIVLLVKAALVTWRNRRARRLLRKIHLVPHRPWCRPGETFEADLQWMGSTQAFLSLHVRVKARSIDAQAWQGWVEYVNRPTHPDPEDSDEEERRRSREPTPTTVWEHSEILHTPTMSGPRGQSVRLRIPLPADLPGTDVASLSPLNGRGLMRHEWLLEISISRTDKPIVFPLPVFADAHV